MLARTVFDSLALHGRQRLGEVAVWLLCNLHTQEKVGVLFAQLQY